MFRASILVLALSAVYVLAADTEKFPDTYDYINIDEILANDRQREQYYKCFMDQGPCVTPEARAFKVYVPESIATQCGRCTDKQKIMLDKISAWYAENQKDKWDALVFKLIEETKKLNKEKKS